MSVVVQPSALEIEESGTEMIGPGCKPVPRFAEAERVVGVGVRKAVRVVVRVVRRREVDRERPSMPRQPSSAAGSWSRRVPARRVSNTAPR